MAIQKLFSICSYEIGTLVFATLNLIGVLSLCALAVGTEGVFVYLDSFGGPVVPLLFLAFYMLFSVLLFLGILMVGLKTDYSWIKRALFIGTPLAPFLLNTPGLILAYFWFGAAVGSLSGLALMINCLLSMYVTTSLTVGTAGIIAFYGVYALILVMIYKTCQKLARAQDDDEDDREFFLVQSENEKSFIMPYYYGVMTE